MQGCVRLAGEAAGPWSLHRASGSQAECQTLGWGAGSAPCQLPACSRSLSKGFQGSVLNRLGCTLCFHFPRHHASPGDTASSPAMSQGSGAAARQSAWTQGAAVPHLHGTRCSVCQEVCASTLCSSPAGRVAFGLGQPGAMADPPGCCRPCATCLLCLYSCRWITAKKRRKGPGTTKVIPRVMLSWGWPAPAWEAQSGGWGGEGLRLGGLSPDMGLLTPCHWSCSPGLSPKRAGVLPGTLSVQGLP